MKESETTRSRVLEALELRRGEGFVSGESLAAALGLSRNAVWKAMEELRREGYRIEAVSRRGYRLSPESDRVSAQGILPFLSPSARGCAEKIRVFSSLGSTNGTAKEMALAGAEHGTAVLSDTQTDGRGRRGRSFFSPEGGLYMSLILRPDAVPFARKAFVTAFAGVAVCEAVEETAGIVPGIKWVNDLLVGGKKICGILTEAVTDFESGSLDWIVVGIGVNVHARPEDFPPGLRETAASIDPDHRIPGIRNRLAAGILNRFMEMDASLSRARVLEKYKGRLMMLGREITVFRGEEAFRATALDLDPEGRLIVRKADGEVLALAAGEISTQL